MTRNGSTRWSQGRTPAARVGRSARAGIRATVASTQTESSAVIAGAR